MTLPEDLFHFIWKYRLFQTTQLVTVSKKALTILDTGCHNRDAGPDFIAARLRIGETEWAGNIEIHVRASEWDIHKHDRDRAYNNVILHVVYEYDKIICREDGTFPETLVLKPLIPSYILSKYRELMSGMYWIPCEKLIHRVPDIHRSQWLSRLLIERLEQKVSAIYALLTQQRGSWEDTCYLWAARSFGFKVNTQAFEQLARILPQTILAKHKQDPQAIESLFFGQAGLLEETEFSDVYPRKLQQEYRYLRQLYSLIPMDASIWKFLRTRPSNFPSIRIAQFAALCLRSAHLFSELIDAHDISKIKSLFTELPVNPYWKRHYRFDGLSSEHGCQLGSESVNNLLINMVSGILFAYGKYIGKETYLYRAIMLLESLGVEKNAVLTRFSAIGIKASQAAESQALLQMKSFYCDKKRCLECGMGLQLIKYKE
ncbi:hypothetical protein GCM10011386_44510 [Parapedobacter defluvii]|uniref:DUF2851 family protein n=1 Tax=Parapedobacter defluvii TaxID=2045106 RepID=A0ABQ1MVN2_9SPHI|nr:DUF2851 family protein [Parapedobacter defluvii]GGC47475.1 hypothetical protein GCM10011386_44510 [Parapedobacter defluvii]